MRKTLLIVISLAIVLAFCSKRSLAQAARVEEREAEWNQYALPQSTFVRKIDAGKIILFYVPSDWKEQPQQSSDRLGFLGPHNANLTVLVGKVADGIPLRDYVAAILQPLRALPDLADSLVVRRTSMSGLEAREIMFDGDDGTGELTRKTIWSVVSGPNAISVVLAEPVANVNEIEPFLKAVVQSVTLIDRVNYKAFDELRSTYIKETKPSRIDEVQSLTAALAALDPSNRKANISRLAAIYASTPDIAIDLTLDSRAMVRSAAFEAIAQSKSNALERFLLGALDDGEPFVAEQAAMAIGRSPRALELARESSYTWSRFEVMARVWPFLSRSNQVKILEEVFAQPLLPAPPAGGKAIVTVKATVLPPGSPPPGVAEQLQPTSDIKRHLNALTLLRDLPAAEFKLPLSKLLEARNDVLTILALQVSWERDEVLPANEMMKLLASDNRQIRWLASLHLGQSGTSANVADIEAVLLKLDGPEEDKPDQRSMGLREREVSVDRIRFREKLAGASGEARQQLIKDGLNVPKISEWVWYRYVKADLSAKPPAIPDLKVLPLGQNIFPRDVTYYAALPKPADAVEKLGSAFAGLQLDSARSQASLVFLLSALKEQLAQQLGAAPGTAVLSYSGINTNEPVALAHWFADGAPIGKPSADRRAIILRVSDRPRFERSLALYQQKVGNFKGLTDYLSGGFRSLTILPVILPLSAKAILNDATALPKDPPLLKTGFIGETSWAGLSIKVVEQRTVDKTGIMWKDAIFLTYVGDVAILAPNLESLIDVLTRESSQSQTLAANTDFKRIRESPAEAIYLSNVTQVFADSAGKDSPNKVIVAESGSLKISNSTWENSYRIQFPESDWLKPIIRFHPEQLTSPKELLPRSTIAYSFMNFDAVAAWREWLPTLLSAEQQNDFASSWATDFEKEVLPELGPECGVAVMGLPSLPSENWDAPWIAFFKLKSNKLEKAILAGQLFKQVTAVAPTANRIKFGNLFVIVRDGFLVFANNESALKALNQKEKLATSRDFSRAARQAPAGLVAFGGYNLEAALEAVNDSGSDEIKSQKLMMVSAVTSAFHSPNFYATASSDSVQGQFSLSMDREGRYSVSELSSLSREFALSYAVIDAQGVPIQNQERLSSLTIKIRASAAGEIERIREAVTSPNQIVEKVSDKEMQLRVLPRHAEPRTKLTLPIKGNEFAVYLQPSNEIRSDDKAVIEQARAIAGKEHDAWQVARKLTEWTFTNIKWKRVDYATAPQTLATLEADCLEFSQLYVAMARSLGLPARIVSGLAHSGSAFGAHAWVEVYVGEWLEVDPTWGTNFVDATHIKNSASGALLTYASLNLVGIEILGAPREIAEFQKNPRTLSEKLSQELPSGDTTALSSALDLTVLTNEKLGSGAWDSLTEAERSVMSAAYPRLLLEISSAFKKEPSEEDGSLRLLKVKETDGRAEAVLMNADGGEVLIKFVFARRDGAWFLTEVLQTDTDLHIISETLYPTFQALQSRKANKNTHGINTSDFVRTLLLISRDPKASVAMADRALQVDPTNQGLFHLKALALSQTEESEEAIQIWRNLAAAPKPFAPAVLNLAEHYRQLEGEANQKTAIEFYLRYGLLEPEDPRPHAALASIYEETVDDVRADSEYRTLVSMDSSNLDYRINFAAFLVRKDRLNEALSTIDKAGKAGDDSDPFGELVAQLYWNDEKALAEKLARNQPQRLAASATANLYIAYVRMENGMPLQAIPLLRQATALKKDWLEPRTTLSQAYRQLRNWTAALKTADAALGIDAESAQGHFERACALARMGQIKEALKALEKAIALDKDVVDQISEEADLKILAHLAEFKKLLPPAEKQEIKPQ